MVDLATRTAKEITGYETHSPGHGNYRLYYQIDGPTDFSVEGGPEGEFGLTIYELDLDTATVSNAGRYVWAPESEAHFSTVGRFR